ncbi:MAG: hypothetical protein P9M12_06850 [Candidatus Aceula lacicola]|nr:hypothetical protein [Candidatus Aceula lacicola]
MRLIKMLFKKNSKASSTVEYAILIILFISAIIAMNQQVRRVFFGRWKVLGDIFGQSQQVSSNTTECMRYVPFDETANYGQGGWDAEQWYSLPCYDCCMDTDEAECPPLSDPTTCRAKSTMRGKKECCVSGCVTQECANL